MENRQKFKLAQWGLSLVVLMTAGCMAPSERIARYITKHPDRPTDVCAALQQQEVMAGMTPEEVRLCLGAPNRIDQTEVSKAEIWHYDRDSSIGGLKGSSIWAMPIPQATVYFSEEGLMKEAVFYEEAKEEPAVIKPAKHKPRPTPKPRTVSRPENPRTRPASNRPQPTPEPYEPAPSELGVSGWPSITLQGVSMMGDEQSAILNGEVFEPGDQIGDVTLIRVYINGVLLSYRGQRTFLRQGNTTK